MSLEFTNDPAPASVEHDDDRLTRAQASEYLKRFQIQMKPATLARAWSVGTDGPPCEHIRGKPWYPRGALRAWAESQHTGLRRSARARRGRGAGAA